MARRPRLDAPGTWHHVVNRAIAKRPYFETRADKRYFLSRLAAQVRAGRLEVHAYCLMTTHFHLLVRSPLGEMSEAMRRVQGAYSRHFNRRRRRDGPLIRARYFSKLVDTEPYRDAVVRYIDANPVHAGVVRTAAEHEFGSARAYVGRHWPVWMSKDWVVRRAVELSRAAKFGPAAYLRAFGPREGEDLDSLAELIELRMASTSELDPLEDLIGKTPIQVRRWMIRKARLADGAPPALPICAPAAVLRIVQQRLNTHGEWLVDRKTRTWRGSELARAGLLRDLCCLPMKQVSTTCGLSVARAIYRVEVHRAEVREGRDHAAIVSEIAHGALSATLAARVRGGVWRVGGGWGAGRS